MKPFPNNLLETLYRPVSLSDLESLDSEFHQSMVWLKENEIDSGGSGEDGGGESGKQVITYEIRSATLCHEE